MKKRPGTERASIVLGVQIGSVDAAGSDFGFREALGAGGMELPAMQAALAGLECGVGPTVGRAHVNDSVRKSLGQDCAQSQAESSRITAGVGGEQGLEHGVVGCEIDEERPARLPI